MEEIFSNLSTTFTTTKIVEETTVKNKKSRNKGASSSNNDKGYLKMISIHPDFVEVIRDPFCKNEIFKFTPRSIAIEGLFAIIKEPFATNDFLDFVSRSLIINKNKETPRGNRCLIE